MKRCELCEAAARMYCDSDRAVLCWDCDTMVHSANFLVARHSRNLLCHVCQSPTPWNASGARLGPAVSLCERCVEGCEGTTVTGGREGESERGENDDIDTEDDYDEDEGEDDDDEGDEFSADDDDEGDEFSADDEDRDNQVVPWLATPPPPATSSSSSEDSSSRFCNGDRADSSKRLRENDADLGSDDAVDCSSCRPSSTVMAAVTWSAGGGGSAFAGLQRPWKQRRLELNASARIQRGTVGCRTAAFLQSIRRFDESSGASASASAGIRKLSRKSGDSDLDSPESL